MGSRGLGLWALRVKRLSFRVVHKGCRLFAYRRDFFDYRIFLVSIRLI